MSNPVIYKLILNKFPQKHIRFAFAYGSAVFKQLNNEATSNSMIDFVFVVDNAIKFHDENLKLNSSHYSSLKYLGPYYLTRIQNDISAGCYYNTLVSLELDKNEDVSPVDRRDLPRRVLMKYGVMSEEALIRDLYDWDYLYVSGRLHKPVKIIKKPGGSSSSSGVGVDLSYSFDSVNKSIDVAMQTNLMNALHASLLLMPEKFTLTELFLTVASLSYTGDFRMVVGENKNKVNNIVTPQLAKFVELYKPYIIKECFEEYLDCDLETGACFQNSNQTTIYHHMNNLPKNLLHTMIGLKFKTSHFYDLEEYMIKMAGMLDYQRIIRQSLANIVKRSSIRQSVKGVFTAGLFKTVNYSWRKLAKMFN